MSKVTKNSLRLIGSLVVVLFLAFSCFAAGAENIPITTTIPQQSSLSIAVSKVTGTSWATVPGMLFDNLVYNSTLNIFTAGYYYVVDVGIICNTSAWSVTHLASSITNGTQSLDNNINVTFVRQVDATKGVELSKVSYANSNNKSFAKTQFGETDWLRIYYGLGIGLTTGPDADATGVTPLVAAAGSGAYNGSVSFTLTP